MTFTDDDLAEYKYKLENVWAFKSDREKMGALIAHLGAAEKVIEIQADHICRWENCEGCLALKEWRKAAGK
jgi:hypothetical protein